MKKYLSLARVSSREQEREGFSLGVQVESLQDKAKELGGRNVKLFSIAETATRADERFEFQEFISYAKEHAHELDGILITKVDRGSRNINDFMELEKLESDYGLKMIYVEQDFPDNAVGRFMRRQLALTAMYQTEDQSQEVKKGIARRVKEGLFPGRAAYGYRNYRVEGRSLVEVHPVNGTTVQRLFHLYAYEHHTIDSLRVRLYEEGLYYSQSKPMFGRANLYNILTSRAYIGEIYHQEGWHVGCHEPLVDRSTWDRVQVLLGGKRYQHRDLAFAGNLIKCGHCGHAITGEDKPKKTKNGVKHYTYYRCARYNKPGHPRDRVTGRQLERSFLQAFSKLEVGDEGFAEWLSEVIRAKARDGQQVAQRRLSDLTRQRTAISNQKDALLNMRLADEIDQKTYSEKDSELRDRLAQINLRIEACDRDQDENAELVIKTFELSQSVRGKWLEADSATKREIVEILCLNLTLDGVNLVPEWRKPFALLAEGLVLKNGRGDCLRTTPNIVLHDFLTANSFEFDWSTFDRYVAFKKPKKQKRAQYNGTAFQLRRQGYFTVGQICAAAGVPDSTFRDWEGLHFPSLPRVAGLRAVSKGQFDALVAQCKALDEGRTSKRRPRNAT